MVESICCRTSLIIGIYHKKLGLVTAAPTFGSKVALNRLYCRFVPRPEDCKRDHCQGRLAVVKSVRPVEQAKTSRKERDKTRQEFM